MSRCNVIGINIDCLNIQDIFREIKVRKLETSQYMATLNIDQFIKVRDSQFLRSLYSEHHLNIIDGQALSWLLKINFRRNHGINRIAGVDVVRNLLIHKEFRIAVLGSSKLEIGLTFKKIYSKATLVYQDDLPPSNLKDDEYISKLKNNLNKIQPDIIFIAIGSPKQEIFYSKYLSDIPGYFIGVGGSFKILSGELKRAPKFMQTLGMEWLIRWIQEPRRLFSRYVTNLFAMPKLFILSVLGRL